MDHPVLVDEAGMIIAGHGRVEVARKLALSDVPVLLARGWSEASKRAYVIADNKLALNAGWDDAMLAAELGDLQAAAFDLDPIGFDASELSKLLGSEDGVEKEDDVPDAPANPVSRGVTSEIGRSPFVVGRCDGSVRCRTSAWRGPPASHGH